MDLQEGLNGVNRQPSNRQKWIILTVNRQLNEALLTVKRLKYLPLRTIIAPNNGVKSTISLYISMHDNCFFDSASL